MRFFKLYFVILLLPARLFAQNTNCQEYILTSKDPQHGQIAKQLYCYDSSKKLIKLENTFTKAYAEEIGYSMQNNYYKNEKPYLFEMLSTDKVIQETGLQARKDFVNERDEIQKVEITLSDKSTWIIAKPYTDIVNEYPIAKNEYYLNFFLNNELSRTSDFNIEATMYKGMSHFQINAPVEKINNSSKQCLLLWQKAHSLKDASSGFTHQANININGKSCILIIPIELTDLGKFKDALVYYLYIGGMKNIPVLICMGFYPG